MEMGFGIGNGKDVPVLSCRICRPAAQWALGS